jgi:anti-anti-sigma regulatory factor
MKITLKDLKEKGACLYTIKWFIYNFSKDAKVDFEELKDKLLVCSEYQILKWIIKTFNIKRNYIKLDEITFLDKCILNEILKILGASELREIQITKEWLEEELEFIKEKTGIDFFKKYSNDLLLNFFKETHQELMEDCIRFYKEEIEYLENTITELYGKGE